MHPEKNEENFSCSLPSFEIRDVFGFTDVLIGFWSQKVAAAIQQVITRKTM